MCQCDRFGTGAFFILSSTVKKSTVVCNVSLFVCRMGHETVVVVGGCFEYSDDEFLDISVTLFSVVSKEPVQYLLLCIIYFLGVQ
jgi:hypothetical protein